VYIVHVYLALSLPFLFLTFDFPVQTTEETRVEEKQKEFFWACSQRGDSIKDKLVNTGFCKRDFGQTNEQQRHYNGYELHREIDSIQTPPVHDVLNKIEGR
jgi:hypothetical protein